MIHGRLGILLDMTMVSSTSFDEAECIIQIIRLGLMSPGSLVV